MKLTRKIALAPIAAAVMALSAASANAATYASFLEYSQVGAWGANNTSNTPPYFGKVTLVEGGSGTGAYVDVHVDIYNGFTFVDTGNTGQHSSFAFNLTNYAASTVTISSANTPPWTLNAENPSDQSPFGIFTTSLDCCKKNGAPGVIPPLDFKVTSTNGITFSGAGPADGFASNAGGWWFAADLLGNGYTGMVAARDLIPTPVVTTVPEPETYAMLLAGLGLMGFVARRRQLKLATV